MMNNFRPCLESLDARIVPDATPTNPVPPTGTEQVSIPSTPPTIQPMPIPPPLTPAEQASLDELRIAALRFDYLAALAKVEVDIEAIEEQNLEVKASQAGLDKAKIDLANAVAAAKPIMQTIVDLWQVRLDTDLQTIRGLINTYRTDRAAAERLYDQLKALGQGGTIPSIQAEEFVLDPTINALVPLHPVPQEPVRIY